MALAQGSKLGPYEILASIGAGGMGEVYRARDPRLERDVAIKVLPVSFSADADRLRRFEQEAKAAGVLNHPNITIVYDIGTNASDGSPFVVQELLEGETLRANLAGGRLSPRKSIEYALQIAHGLAAAHEKGIVHRDLKPENLFVTKDGRVKILDFGLAKLTQRDGGAASTDLPTETRGTEPGVVLGTLGYMSPEQVRGKPADARSDIFSFGAILYEMLSGNRAFQGDSAADTMSAILREDPPDLSVTNQSISPGLERIVRHCIEKNPEQRFHSAHDVGFALDAITGASAPSAVGAPAAPAKKRRRWLAIAGALAAAAAVFAAGRYLRSGPPVAGPPVYRQMTFRHGDLTSARFTPDGQVVLYTAAWESNPPELFQARVGLTDARSLDVRDVEGIVGATSSGEMAILLRRPRGATLARLPMTGGTPREVAEGVTGADIAPDGQNLAVARFTESGFQLEYPIGKPVYKSTGMITFPRISPDGEKVAFLDHPLIGDDRGQVWLASRNGQKRKLTGDWASLQGLAWSPSGEEIWFTAAEKGANLSVRVVSLDGKTREVLPGPGRLILHDIAPDGRLLLEEQTVRRALMCLPPGETRERDLSWLDYTSLQSISRDGSLLLIGETGEGGGEKYGTFIRKTDGSPAVRLGDGVPMAFSPNEKSVLTAVPGPSQKLVILPLGAGEPQTLPDFGILARGGSWLPDGKRLILGGTRPGEPMRIHVQEIAGGPARTIGPEASGGPAELAPDGRVIFGIRSDGKAMMYPVDAGEPREVEGYAPGEWPAGWSADSRFLYLYNPREMPVRVYRADVTTGRRELWREIRPADATGVGGMSTVVVSQDGRTYAYDYSRSLSELYVVEGVK